MRNSWNESILNRSFLKAFLKLALFLSFVWSAFHSSGPATASARRPNPDSTFETQSFASAERKWKHPDIYLYYWCQKFANASWDDAADNRIHHRAEFKLDSELYRQPVQSFHNVSDT